MDMKRFHLTIRIFAIIVLSSLIYSCAKHKKTDVVVPPVDTVFTLTPDTLFFPPHFPAPIIPADNQPCKEKEQLGRMLYYDSILSNDGRYCAGCHIQSNAFSSRSLYNNVMPVLPHENLAWYTNYMWDGSKSGTLEDVMEFEVETFFGTDLNKINQNTKYKALFKKYFNTTNITHKDIAYSLAQFLRTVITRTTKYDKTMTGMATLTSDEYMGYRIFFTEKGDCFHCHINPIMTDNNMHNTGLDSLYTKEADKGYFNVTANPVDLGKFRTPNLRNVALRNHYMHDGRFTTLEEVVDFYDHGMHKVNNLDPIMSKAFKADGLHLSNEEKSQLISFLKTLTDSTFITDASLNNPN